jgi:hypothetical protein
VTIVADPEHTPKTSPAHERQHRAATALAALLTLPAPVCGWRLDSVYSDDPISGILARVDTLDEARVQFHQWAAVLDSPTWSIREHPGGSHRLLLHGTFAGVKVEIWDLCEVPDGFTVDDLSAPPELVASRLLELARHAREDMSAEQADRVSRTRALLGEENGR